jgi:hypothetical protein
MEVRRFSGISQWIRVENRPSSSKMRESPIPTETDIRLRKLNPADYRLPNIERIAAAGRGRPREQIHRWHQGETRRLSHHVSGIDYCSRLW